MPDDSTADIKSAPSSLATPTDLDKKPVEHVTAGLNTPQPDVFALCLKSKNFQWHMSEANFRDWHLRLDEQADRMFATTDVVAEPVRNPGHLTLHSIGEIARYQRIKDKHEAHVWPHTLLAELRDDNGVMAQAMRKVHANDGEASDVATTCLLETFIDEAARRAWLLFEPARGHANDK